MISVAATAVSGSGQDERPRLVFNVKSKTVGNGKQEELNVEWAREFHDETNEHNDRKRELYVGTRGYTPLMRLLSLA